MKSRIAASLVVAGLLVASNATADGRPSGGIMGWVEGWQGNTLTGWACDQDVYDAIDVHFYLDAPPGSPGSVGPLIKTANLPREAAVGYACRTPGVPHGWSVDATPYIMGFAGRKIFVYGISRSGGPNDALHGSGLYVIPRVPFSLSTTVESEPSSEE